MWSASRARLRQFQQRLSHGFKSFDFAFNVSNLRFRSPSDFGPVCPRRHTQCQQLPNFPKRKAEFLRAFDESQSPRRVRWKVPIAGCAAGRLGKKPLPFIKADGFQVDANLLGEASNCERLCIACCHYKASLNPVVWYRVKSFFEPKQPRRAKKKRKQEH